MMHFLKHLVFATACLVVFGGCAANDVVEDTAQANASAPVTGQANAEGQYVNKVVCKRILPTGSRTNATKVCATVAEWEELSRGSQDAVNEHNRRTGMSNRMEGN
jgi:Flp pilus assembly protein CpaB